MIEKKVDTFESSILIGIDAGSEVANDIDSSAFALPCAVPLIQLTSASRPGGDKRPPHPLGACGGGGGGYILRRHLDRGRQAPPHPLGACGGGGEFILLGVRDLVWGVTGLGMVRAWMIFRVRGPLLHGRRVLRELLAPRVPTRGF